MDSFEAVEVGRGAIYTTLMIGGPLLLVGLLIGVVVGVFQTITQIQDQAVSIVPKILISLVVIAACMPWLFRIISEYSTQLIENIPNIVAGG